MFKYKNNLIFFPIKKERSCNWFDNRNRLKYNRSNVKIKKNKKNLKAKVEVNKISSTNAIKRDKKVSVNIITIF